MTTEHTLRVEDRGRIRWLTIDRPGRRNAIPQDGWQQLQSALHDFERSDRRVLVIMGAGEDFCSGADLAGDAFASDAGSVATAQAAMRTVGRAAQALHSLSKPTIAAVDGVAVGAGMNLALGCDVVIATTRVRFGEVFVKRGLTMDFGGTWLLPRIIGMGRARELALTGRVVEAEEAMRIGLVARVVAPADLAVTAAEVADELAAGAPLAQRFIKVGLARSLQLGFEQALEYESQAQAVLLASEDVAEGVAAFVEKRSPHFEGR